MVLSKPTHLLLFHTDLTSSKGDEGVASALQFENLKKEDSKLVEKFEKLVNVVQASFIQNEVKFNDIRLSLKFIERYEEKQMVKHLLKDLRQDQSLDDLFFFFSDIWNYLHPGLLEFIVERFGTISDKGRVKEYKEELEKFQGNVKLGEFVKIICKRPAPSPSIKELSMYVGDDWRDKTLRDLEEVRLQVADKNKCDRFLIRAFAKQSRFTIVFSMPSWIHLNLVDLYPVLATIGATKVFLNEDYICEGVSLKVCMTT